VHCNECSKAIAEGKRVSYSNQSFISYLIRLYY
jgi:hypothetical protein